ncbi:copper amine oxidase N-terminal domain-containing protein [Paenibacillus sp. FSL K6-2859]|jgi:hypothetical protein|uniref:copper amine oxidase N-terminal domain-containing protein n=1 Tax=Paenibacillus sp. FSL K6-2859 TaxID=2921482 RepID=UPI0030FC9AF4
MRLSSKIQVFCFTIVLIIAALTSAHLVSAESNTIHVLVGGINEGDVAAPIVTDNVQMLPIGPILKITDTSGGETVSRSATPTQSFVTFRGTCYKFTEGDTNVTEYVVDESGACFELTGQTYQLEKPSIFPYASEGAFAPLSFLEKIILETLDKDIEISSSQITIARFDNKRNQSHVFGSQEDLKKLQEGNISDKINPGIVLAMKINSPWLLTLDDGGTFDSNDGSVTPIVSKGATLLPIAPIVERLGGTVEWSGNERKITIKLETQTIELWLDQKKALVNSKEKSLTVAPTVVKGRTMLPVRFVTENLGAIVRWNRESKIVMVYYGGAKEQEADLFTFDYKIAMLDIYKKSEDNHVSLADAVDNIQKEHEKIQYNNTDPLDYSGRLIHVGDVVGVGTFDGVVKEIKGTKVLVYLNQASFLVDKGKEEETARMFGINWLDEQWIEAKKVTINK